MSSAFPRSTYALATDRGRGMAAGILLVTLLLSAWLAWGCFARLALYEVADTARLEGAALCTWRKPRLPVAWWPPTYSGGI